MISGKLFKFLLLRILLILILHFYGAIDYPLNARTSLPVLHSHHRHNPHDSLRHAGVITDKDTIPHFSFPPVEIRGAYIFKNRHQEKKYRQLCEDIKRTYSLSRLVLREVKLVNAKIDSINRNKAEERAYLKWYEKHIYNTYIDTLKTLNIRQIRLFIKLIDRETGNSPYKLIKKYRGGLDAFLWQLAANAMMLNLKSEYDPVEEAMIEDIITKYY